MATRAWSLNRALHVSVDSSILLTTKFPRPQWRDGTTYKKKNSSQMLKGCLTRWSLHEQSEEKQQYTELAVVLLSLLSK